MPRAAGHDSSVQLRHVPHRSWTCRGMPSTSTPHNSAPSTARRNHFVNLTPLRRSPAFALPAHLGECGCSDDHRHLSRSDRSPAAPPRTSVGSLRPQRHQRGADGDRGARAGRRPCYQRRLRLDLHDRRPALLGRVPLGIAALPPTIPEGERHRPGLASIRSGLAFLKLPGTSGCRSSSIFSQ
jgi:hypothetical protein